MKPEISEGGYYSQEISEAGVSDSKQTCQTGGIAYMPTHMKVIRGGKIK